MTRLLTRKVPFTFNRAGYYYFSRRVPADLTQLYFYPRIVQGLKTRSAHTAKTRALVAAAKLDEYWSHLQRGTEMYDGVGWVWFQYKMLALVVVCYDYARACLSSAFTK